MLLLKFSNMVFYKHFQLTIGRTTIIISYNP